MSDLASLPEVLTIAEVAAFLRVDPKTVRDTLVNTHLLKAHKVGSQWRVLRAELEEYLMAQLIPIEHPHESHWWQWNRGRK